MKKKRVLIHGGAPRRVVGPLLELPPHRLYLAVFEPAVRDKKVVVSSVCIVAARPFSRVARTRATRKNELAPHFLRCRGEGVCDGRDWPAPVAAPVGRTAVRARPRALLVAKVAAAASLRRAQPVPTLNLKTVGAYRHFS